MPKELEERLRKVASKYASQGKLKRKKGESSKAAEDRFVYGIMRKRGWKPSRER